MRKLISIAAVLLCSSVLAPPAYAQKAAETVKPAASPSQAVLDQWNDIGRKLVAMAEDFPEDKYDFKPNQRAPADSMLAVASRLCWIACPSTILGRPDTNCPSPRHSDKPPSLCVVR